MRVYVKFESGEGRCIQIPIQVKKSFSAVKENSPKPILKLERPAVHDLIELKLHSPFDMDSE